MKCIALTDPLSTSSPTEDTVWKHNPSPTVSPYSYSTLQSGFLSATNLVKHAASVQPVYSYRSCTSEPTICTCPLGFRWNRRSGLVATESRTGLQLGRSWKTRVCQRSLIKRGKRGSGQASECIEEVPCDVCPSPTAQ